jgi:hypothetical protein
MNVVEEIATLLARGFLKARQRPRPRQLGSENPDAGLAFQPERSVHVSEACAVDQGKEDATRRFEGN